MLSKDVDVLIGGGSRGGSKTFSLLLEALYDVYKKNFRAILFRNEIGDFFEQCVIHFFTGSNLIEDIGRFGLNKIQKSFFKFLNFIDGNVI